MLRRPTLYAALALLIGSARAADAQAPTEMRKNLISINPLLAVAGYFIGEYERVIARSATFSVGGSHLELGDGADEATYAAADVKLRYYANNRALRGFAVAGVVGYTRVDCECINDEGVLEDQSGNALALGTQLDYSWLLGEKENFSIGLGLGMKRLIFVGDEVEGEDLSLTLPTGRLSIGLAF